MSPPGLDIGQKLAYFLEGLEIIYQSIFLSVWSDNVKWVKKKEKYGKIGNNVFLSGFGYRLELGPFSNSSWNFLSTHIFIGPNG